MFGFGEIVKVPRVPYWHFGVSLGSKGVIDHAKIQGVARRTWEEFAKGRRVVSAEISGPFVGEEVVARAYSQIGKPYDLLEDNCEHFARWCVGTEAKSVQIQKYTLVAPLMAAACYSKSPSVAVASIAGAIGATLAPEGKSPAAYAAVFGLLGFIGASLTLSK